MPRCAKRQPVSRHATAATAAERSAWEQQASATEKLCFQMALHFLAFPRASKGSRFLHVSTVSPGAASMPAGLAAEAWTWTPLAQASADFSHTLSLGKSVWACPEALAAQRRHQPEPWSLSRTTGLWRKTLCRMVTSTDPDNFIERQSQKNETGDLF